jgi:hypothetical protein
MQFGEGTLIESNVLSSAESPLFLDFYIAWVQYIDRRVRVRADYLFKKSKTTKIRQMISF